MNNSIFQVIPCDFSNPDHCNALIELMNEYITDKMGGGKPYTDAQKIKLVEGLRDHPTHFAVLAHDGKRFVGLVNAFVNFATFTVKPYVNIHDVIVTADYRNRGVGKKMLETVVKRAHEEGCSKVTLEVREDNVNARHLYNNLGFHDEEPRQFYWTKYL